MQGEESGGVDQVISQLKEAWSKINRWCLEANCHQAPTTSEGLEKTSTLWEDLYSRRPPEGEPLPNLVKPLSIADRPPEGEDITIAVRKLRTGRPRGPSGIKVGHMETWLREATREKDPDTKKWDKLVNIMQVSFWHRYIS